jgi:hypothetical protein
VTLTNRDTGGRHWRRELQRRLWCALDEIRPQVVVVNGWSSTDAFSAIRWCAETNIPAVITSESTAWDDPRMFWKEWIKGRLVKMFGAGLAGGTPHIDYLAQLGLPRGRIFNGYDIVDNDYFAAKTAEVRSQKSEVRNQHGLPEKYFLASARFIVKKNLPRLIEAYARYLENRKFGNWFCSVTGRFAKASSLKSQPSICATMCCCPASSSMTNCRRISGWPALLSMQARRNSGGL